MSQYDVVVIGGGAAGLSAALVLSRARRTVLVVDAGAPRNAPATHLHGYLSRDGMPPAELLAAGREEVESYGGEIVDGTVTDLVPDGHRVLWLSSPVGSGSRRGDCWSRPACATSCRTSPASATGGPAMSCTAPTATATRSATAGSACIGGTPGAVRYAQIVRQWTHDLVYFTPPDILTAAERTQLLARAIGVVEGTIDQLVIDDDGRAARRADARRLCHSRDALFVPPRFVPNSALLVGLGCDVDADGWVTVDNTGRTSVPGVWAAGNIVDPRAQVITAAGAGSAAAIALNADLVEDDVRNAVRDLDHGFALAPTTNAHPKESP